jgi:putative lipoprotein
MRTVTGVIRLPEDVPDRRAATMLVEVRDVSMADAPSTVVASRKIRDVELEPSKEIKFRLKVPEAEANRMLSLRVHISLEGGDRIEPGDLLTTAIHPVAAAGSVADLEIPVVRI